MAEVQSEAWHLAQLRIMDSILQGIGYQTHLLEKSARVPYSVLLMKLALPGERKPLELALSFYPVRADEVKHTLLLQYFTELPLVGDAAGLARVRELLPDLNEKTVLGHFGVAAGRQTITYRYVQALPMPAPITHDAVADVVILVGYTPALFIDLIAGVVDGSLTVSDAQRQLATQYTS